MCSLNLTTTAHLLFYDPIRRRRQNAYPANEDEKAVCALGPGFRPVLWAGGAFERTSTDMNFLLAVVVMSRLVMVV